MSRQSFFGQWGVELDQARFARALAAAGVLWVSPFFFSRIFSGPPALLEDALDALKAALAPGPVAWRLRYLEPSLPDAIPASVLASAWEAAQGQGLTSGVRLEVEWWQSSYRPPGVEAVPDFDWIARQLARPEVGVASVYLPVDEPDVDLPWHWPLRIGLFPAGAATAALRERLDAAMSANGYLDPIVRLITPGDGDDCDLLLVPEPLPAAVAALLQAPRPVRTGCVIVLGGRGGGVPGLPLLLAARGTAAITGIAVAPVAEAKQGDWLVTLVRTLAHDRPLDVALHTASWGSGTGPAVLAVSRRLLRTARVSRAFGAIADDLVRSHPQALVDLPEPAARRLKLKPGPAVARTVGRRMRELAGAKDLVWEREVDDATTTAHLAGARRAMAVLPTADVMKALSDVPKENRFLKMEVADAADGRTEESGPPVPASARPGEAGPGQPVFFRRGRTYRVTVRIGPRDLQSIMPTSGHRFPEEQLPPDQDRHQLVVVMTEPRILTEPQARRIELPPTGNSTPATFFLPTAAPARGQSAGADGGGGGDAPPDAVEARVIVSYRNRVLQTAMIRGTILPDGADGTATDEVRLDVEAVVHPVADLSRRRPFDAALVLNHTTDGHRPAVTVLTDRAFAFRLADLSQSLQYFDTALSGIRARPEEFDGLTAPATVDLLREFAKHGRELYEAVNDWLGDTGVTAAERIQVISVVAEARLPIEFAYDRPAPVGQAGMCPHADAALGLGRCPGECPNATSRAVVCPMGFWGMRKVIERHKFDSAVSRGLAGSDFAFRAEPLAGRDTLDPRAGALFAASDRVDRVAGESTRAVSAALTTAAGEPVGLVSSWPEWVRRVAERPRSLHVLIVHSEFTESDIQVVEIGGGDQLELSAIGEEHVNPAGRRPMPIVLLIGCETNRPDIAYEKLTSKLRRMGAAIVVASGSFILGRHAAPVVRALIECLAEVPADGRETFGEVMRRVRCLMLRRGIPMVLCLSAFGDADWRLAHAGHAAPASPGVRGGGAEPATAAAGE